MKRERRAVRRVGDELVPLDYAVRTVKGRDRACAGSGERRCGLRDAGISALAEERPAARMFDGGDELPARRTGAAQARLTVAVQLLARAWRREAPGAKRVPVCCNRGLCGRLRSLGAVGRVN